jgi:hypothetical protein
MALAVVAGSIAVAGSSDRALRRTKTLRLLDVQGGFEYLDLGEPAQSDFDPSPGDVMFFRNTLRDRGDSRDVGRFISRCTSVGDAEFHCQGTLLLGAGKIELATTADFASSDPIVAAVVGGTARFKNVTGQATITSTETEGRSRLVVELIPAG